MEAKNSFIKTIPNILTSINIIIGCLAITLAFENNLLISAYLVLLAAFIDFFDGFLARKLNAVSELGKILDSLADMVCFGVTPAVIMYHIIAMSLMFHNPQFNIESANLMNSVIMYSPFMLAVFSGIRLARFSSTTGNTKVFVGLPTPAVAIFIASIALLFQETDSDQLRSLILNGYFLILLVILLSLLMVSRLELFSLKFDNFSFTDNKIRYIFIIISIVLLTVFQLTAIPIVVILYILLSLGSKMISGS